MDLFETKFDETFIGGKNGFPAKDGNWADNFDHCSYVVTPNGVKQLDTKTSAGYRAWSDCMKDMKSYYYNKH